MAQQDYNRYSILKNSDGSVSAMPFVTLPERSTDKYEYWNLGFSRLDKLSDKYYGTPFYDFLIIYANPEYTNEFDIPDNALIRIPFPLAQARSDYEGKLEQLKNQ